LPGLSGSRERLFERTTNLRRQVRNYRCHCEPCDCKTLNTGCVTKLAGDFGHIHLTTTCRELPRINRPCGVKNCCRDRRIANVHAKQHDIHGTTVAVTLPAGEIVVPLVLEYSGSVLLDDKPR